MKILLLLFLGHVVAILAHTLGLYLAGRLAGASVSEVGVFNGPALATKRVGYTALRLNLIPLGGYVKFADAEGAPSLRGRGRLFEELSPLTRVLIASSGCLALLVLAAACLGPASALRHIASGFPQLVRGALHPLAVGAPLVARLVEFVATHPVVSTVGLIASKELAFNLLPVPILNGGDIIMILVQAFRRFTEKARERIYQVGFLLLLAFAASWAVALIHFLLGRAAKL
jgi:membrane-associated protease RseP (regulator of RpoE activity)